MEFDWTTFILEIINFIILVWILKRFLYRPILDVIARRRAGIEKTLTDAKQIETEANKIKQQNEQYLVDLEIQKETAQAQLMTELAAVRESKMAALEATMAQETERRRVLDERRRQEFERLIEEQGVVLGAKFSTKLLSRLASVELEAKLYKLLLEDLQHLSDEKKQAVIAVAGEADLQIEVQSAFLLDNNKQDGLTTTLTSIIGTELPVEYSINPDLISGLYISIGPWILHANLRDELKSFCDLLHHSK